MDIRDYDEFDCEELYSIEKCDGKYELSVGSEKKVYIFDSHEDAINYLRTKSEEAAFILEEMNDYSEEFYGHFVTEEDLETAKKAINSLKNSNEEINRLYKKHKKYYKFDYIFDKTGVPGRYTVYNYHTVEDGKIFYVNMTEKELSLELSHGENKKELQRILEKYEVEPTVLAEGLPYVQAEIYVRCLMLEYTDQGHYMLAATAKEYRRHKDLIEHRNGNNEFDVRITENLFFRTFYPEIDQNSVKFDKDFTLEDLQFIAYSKNGDSIIREKSRKVIKYLDNQNAKTFQTLTAKGIRTLIVNGPVDFGICQTIKENGGKIVDIRDVIALMEDNGNDVPKFEKAGGTRIPKYDEELREKIRTILSEQHEYILELSKEPSIRKYRYYYGEDTHAEFYERNFPNVERKDVWISDIKEYIYKSFARMYSFSEKTIEVLDISPFAFDLIKLGLFDEAIDFFEKYVDIEKLPMSYRDVYMKAIRYRDAELEKKNKTMKKSSTSLKGINEQIVKMSESQIREKVLEGFIIRDINTGKVICPAQNEFHYLSTCEKGDTYGIEIGTCKNCEFRERCGVKKEMKRIVLTPEKNFVKIQKWNK